MLDWLHPWLYQAHRKGRFQDYKSEISTITLDFNLVFKYNFECLFVSLHGENILLALMKIRAYGSKALR